MAMVNLSRVFTGAALEDGSRQLCVRVENPDGTSFEICSDVYFPTRYLVDGNLNFFRKRTSTPEELKFLTDQRDIFEKLYDRVENIVRVSEGHISSLTQEWVLSILAMDDRGGLKKKGSWITLKSILQEAGQVNEVDTKRRGSRKLYDFIKQYYLTMGLSGITVEKYQIIARMLMREEMYHQSVLGETEYSLDIDTITSDMLRDFQYYCLNEGNLEKKNPEQFEVIRRSVGQSFAIKKQRHLQNKQTNQVVGIMFILKKVFKFLRQEARETTNDPFRSYAIGDKEYNSFPIYFTSHELNLIRKVDLSEEPLLETQRDILLFHCLTGCRYRDMIKLTDANVEGDEIVYEPIFNVKENIPAEPVISLVKEASELINKYEGVDNYFRLFPFISKVYYEDCCKEILAKANVNRIVFVFDSKQRKQVGKRLCEAFDANVPLTTYRIVNNREEVSSMVSEKASDEKEKHIQPSYRGITDDVLTAAISLIE